MEFPVSIFMAERRDDMISEFICLDEFQKAGA